MARSRVARIDSLSRTHLGYALGYQDAANLIIDSLDNYDDHPDLLLFPVAFLYRHATELILKRIIYLGNSMSGGKPKIIIDHNLGRLWHRAHEYLLKYPDGSEGSYLYSLDSSIKRLHKIDPTSEAFRYVINKHGTLSLPNDEWVDLHIFKKDMDGLINTLTACSDYLDELNSNGP